MSTLSVDFPSLRPGPVGQDGLNDYQREHLDLWLNWNSKRSIPDRAAILRAVAEDPRLLHWADWRSILAFGRWLEDQC